MNRVNTKNNNQDGIPDEEMPELKEDDFARSKPNRFAKHIFRLDEDVSAYFKSSKEINEALRLVIKLNEVVSHK